MRKPIVRWRIDEVGGKSRVLYCYSVEWSKVDQARIEKTLGHAEFTKAPCGRLDKDGKLIEQPLFDQGKIIVDSPYIKG